MGYINVMVGTNCQIKVKSRQLLLQNENQEITYALEDVNSVLIESIQTTITTYAINELSKHNIILYFCDEKHMPSTYMLNYNGFFKNLNIYKLQTEVSKPIQKNIWKHIVINKILNQIEVLNILNIKNDLIKYVEKVKSGDVDNVEAIVANKYFKLLFGGGFARNNDNSIINSALNYGYAIIRGAIARSLVSHGLQSYLGIFHKNELNAFNLADDFVEPFRPVVDLFVYQHIGENINELNKECKMKLYSLLNMDVRVDGKTYDLNYAIELFINCYIKSLKLKTVKIATICVKPLMVHAYE